MYHKMMNKVLFLGIVISACLNLWLLSPLDYLHKQYQINTIEMLDNTMSDPVGAEMPWSTFAKIMRDRVLAFDPQQSPMFVDVSLYHHLHTDVVLIEFSWMESPVGNLPDAVRLIDAAGESLAHLTLTLSSHTSKQLIRSSYLEIAKPVLNNAVGILLLANGRIMDYYPIMMSLNEIE